MIQTTMKMNKNYFKQCIPQVYQFLGHKDENRFSNWIILIGIRKKKVDSISVIRSLEMFYF